MENKLPLSKPSYFGDFLLFDFWPCERAGQRHPARSIQLLIKIALEPKEIFTHTSLQINHTVLPPNGDCVCSVSTRSLAARDCLDCPFGAFMKSRISICKETILQLYTHWQTKKQKMKSSHHKFND